MGNWQQVGENLVRYKGGTIYLRAKVAGKIKQLSLETTDLRIAKIKRDVQLEGMRKAAVVNAGKNVRSIGDAIGTLSTRVLGQPDLAAETVKYYGEIFGILRQTLPCETLARTWTATEASAWWKSIAKKYAAQRANNVLGMGKRLGKLILELGLRIDDPTAGLKRVPIPEKALNIPSLAEVEQMIESIRAQAKGKSEEAANFVAFLAFAGCRCGQARALQWEHVQGDWLLFPSGVTGTKKAKTRRLPISPALRPVLDQMKPKDHKGPLKGPVFTLKRPHEALKAACKRIGIDHMRIHDLRHFFATFSLESGVDVGTVSRWLGHKDGGVLVLRTYGHLRDDHSLVSAQKLQASAPVSKAP